MYHSLFNHCPIEGYLGCVNLGATMNDVTMNICKQVFYVSVYFYYFNINAQEYSLLGYMVNVCSVLQESAKLTFPAVYE